MIFCDFGKTRVPGFFKITRVPRPYCLAVFIENIFVLAQFCSQKNVMYNDLVKTQDFGSVVH